LEVISGGSKLEEKGGTEEWDYEVKVSYQPIGAHRFKKKGGSRGPFKINKKAIKRGKSEKIDQNHNGGRGRSYLRRDRSQKGGTKNLESGGSKEGDRWGVAKIILDRSELWKE